MSDSLKFTMLSKIEYTIQTRTHGYTSGVVMSSSECAEHLSFDVFNLSRVRVIFLLSIPEEPVHTITYARCDVYVFEEREVRKTDLEIVGHTILELVPEAWLVELGGFEIDPVLQRCVISEGEFLIPLLLADPVLAFERVESADRECHIRKCE